MKTFSFVVFGVVSAAASLASPAVAGAETYNYQGRDTFQYVNCYGFDEASGEYSSFYAYASESRQRYGGGETGGYTYGYAYYYSYNYVTGAYCSGYAQIAEQSVSSGLSEGRMEGTLTLYCEEFDPTTGSYVYTQEDVPVEVSLEGVGSTYRSSSSSRYQEPPHYNSVYKSSGTYRAAMPTVLIDGEELSTTECYGTLGKGKSSSHVNYNP